MRAPFHAGALLDFLAARCVPGVEVVAGPVYRRAVEGAVAQVTVGPDGIEGDEALAGRLVDPAHDPVAADAVLRRPLRALVDAAPGLRVPLAVDAREVAVRALVGQQVSVAAARTVLGRLVAAHGAPLPRPRGGITHAFPEPAALARIDPEELPMPRARGHALVGLAAALADGMPVAPDALLALPGVGPWTAGYVALRTGDPDVLLTGDLGVRTALRRFATVAAADVAPYGSTATVHLWRSLAPRSARGGSDRPRT